MSAPGAEHERFEELAVAWALHALEPDEAALFAAHLAQCERCARVVDETVEVMAAMAETAPSTEPPDALRSRLRAAVETTDQVDPPAVPSPARPASIRPDARPGPRGGGARRWRRTLPAALVAAAVAAIVGLGVWNLALLDARDDARADARAQAEIVEALLDEAPGTITPVADDDGRTVATVLARDGEVQVLTHGIAANDPEATTYVLWGIREQTPTALGTFDVQDAQPAVQTFGVPGPAGYSAYGISLEPGRTAPPAPSDVVASGAVRD
jgi:hypothetical protein